MSDLEVQPAQGTAAGLTQWQRVGNAFAAPAKTFEDIQRGNRSWWLPFLIAIVVSYVLFAAITLRIGWPQVAQNAIHFNPKSEARLAQVPDAQREMTMKITQNFMEGIFLASPLLVLIIALITSLVLVGTINFGFGGRAKLGSVFAVWFYATLPGAIKALLGAVAIFSGLAPDSFNLNNFAPTNVGAFLNPLDTGAALYKLASGLDVTTIWSVALLSIGLATVAGVKRSSGYIAVFGWWALILLVSVGWAAAFS
jgi:hypothetical protein